VTSFPFCDELKFTFFKHKSYSVKASVSSGIAIYTWAVTRQCGYMNLCTKNKDYYNYDFKFKLSRFSYLVMSSTLNYFNLPNFM
jgi:hypothetical protein